MTIAQVVQLGATHAAAGDYLDGIHVRGVQRELTLHAHAERDLANREGCPNTGTTLAVDDALEDLDVVTLASTTLDVDLTVSPGREFWTLGQRRFVNLVDNVQLYAQPPCAQVRVLSGHMPVRRKVLQLNPIPCGRS